MTQATESVIIHPDTLKPAKIANTIKLPSGTYRIQNIEGSPSDGYGCIVTDFEGKTVAKGYNYMNGDGWYLYKP